MKYCMKCGVLIDEEKNRICPLCNTIILNDVEIDNLSISELKIKRELKKDNREIKVKKEKKNIVGVTAYIMFIFSFVAIFNLLIIDLSIGFNIDWSIIPIISICLFLLTVSLPFMSQKKKNYWYITFDTIMFCIYFLLLNYFINKNISWSYYVVLSIILLWVYLSTILLSKLKGFIIKASLDFIATAIYVLLITLGFEDNSAFSRLVLPINGLVFILTITFYMFFKTYIYNWRLILSTLSINVSILCLGIDLIIQRYIYDELSLRWSYIVLMVLIPFTLFIFYLDNRYKIHSYLTKKFHI